jgi:hypothetical protein
MGVYLVAGFTVFGSQKVFGRWPLNYWLNCWWGNPYSFSLSLAFSKHDVRICPVYLSEFIVFEKKVGLIVLVMLRVLFTRT